MWDIIGLLVNICLSFIKSFAQIIWKPSQKSMHGEVVLVTGAGHGMGRLFALKFASLGSTIVVVDVNEQGNQETKSLLEEKGAKVFAYTTDLRKCSEIKKLADQIREDVGDVTMLINNAGVIYCTDILSLTEEMINNTFSVNILSHFWLIKEFLPQMKKKNHGHIVGIASYAGYFANAYMTDYSASKHAVVGMMDALRDELHRCDLDGVKLSVVCPTFVSTGFVKNPRSKLGAVTVVKPEEVVEAAVPAILRNQFTISVPSFNINLVLRAILPTAVSEAIYNFIRPEVDLLDSKRE